MAAHFWFCLATGLMALQGTGPTDQPDQPGPRAALQSAEAVTEKMRQRLEGVRSLSARYAVTTYAPVLDQRSETSGRLFLQRDENRLRLEEAHQTIVSDGESLWTHVHENRQVIVSPAQEAAAGTRPDEFIFNYTNRYRYDLEGTEPVDGTPCYVLALTAVGPFDGIPALRIWVEEGTWLTTRVRYQDDMGYETTLRFMDFRLNEQLPADLFTMTTPDHVEWVDLR